MLNQLKTQLTKREWLCETAYSLADIVWTAVLNRLEELKFDNLWIDSTRPALAGYFQRLKARPSFKAAIQSDNMPLPMLLAGLRKTFLGL
ncbi:MAG: glutathione S-transferase family protein [Oscillatoriophycideae cyanobacterium NC_groundwater_1537_Pr4_S-0.65um_50_18]|nr:glutathione S-transferase family protein [Oscillatoriophycideae cyanobacterium NC_groundwater_1537_Pr4_S-0.65um_50_18]